MSDNFIYGTQGNDTLNGTSGKDSIYGYDGDDTIFAGDQDDTIFGGYGDDLIYPSWGANTVDGGYGIDRVVVEGLSTDHDIFVDGNTIMIGGPGKWYTIRNVEWILYAPSGQTVEHLNVNGYLAAHYNYQWDNFVSATDGGDWVAGGDGNDRLQGDEGEDVFFSWENKWMGAATLLAEQTGDTLYFNDLAEHFDWAQGLQHTPGTSTNEGLIWDGPWGSNRYAANTALLAVQHAQTLMENGASANDPQVRELFNFAADQIDYTLGDNPDGQSYLIGFGSDYPLNPHHRAASGMDNWSEYESSAPNEHILYGALVGGPDVDGNWVDDRTDHVGSEVATDYNAAYSSVLAALIDYDSIV